jgi:hypothetical protein
MDDPNTGVPFEKASTVTIPNVFGRELRVS